KERYYYPASSAQKRMFIVNRVKGDDISDIGIGAVTLDGDLDKTQFEKSVKTIIDRHEILRTSFELLDEEIVQRVHKEVDFAIEYMEAAEDDVEGIVKTFIHPFNLGQAPLVRVGLVKLSEKKHILMFSLHHIISDATSMNVINEEFVRLYSDETLPPLKIQYKDFAAWQNRLAQSEKIREQENYWTGIFQGEIPQLDLPADYHRPEVQDFEGESIEFQFDAELTEKIKKLALDNGVTLFMLLLAIYYILLSRYSGREDIIVGTPNAGRLHTELQNLIGMFVNTLALRACPTGNKIFADFLREVKNSALKAFENQDYQFESLVEKLEITPDPRRQPLFDTMFALQNTTDYSKDHFHIREKNLIFTPYHFDETITQFDIMLHAFEKGYNITFKMLYRTRLFKKETMETLASHLINIAGAVVKNPGVRISAVEILSHGQRENLGGMTKKENLHQLDDDIDF
ncbi:MAG: non-ribosomal peptide synthetase, partial [bacterium]|nr:non-ribosomal peptide synthetase [bacterium]